MPPAAEPPEPGFVPAPPLTRDRQSVPSPLAELVRRQNADGGWPYQRGSSRVEPTVFALLALAGQSEGPPAVAAGQGLDWLRASQRLDGGWIPAPGVDESTWVTALPLLLPPGTLGPNASSAAARWLIHQTGRESSFFYRLRQLVSGSGDAHPSADGWPWFPGSAAWVIPTAFALLALARVRHAADSQLLRDRLVQGTRFLLDHRCADGGWNHGAARTLSYSGSSYPEATGLALLALAELPSPVLAQSLVAAERHLASARSAEAIAWLHLGLRAHHRDPGPWPANIQPRTVCDLALVEIARTTGPHSNCVRNSAHCDRISAISSCSRRTSSSSRPIRSSPAARLSAGSAAAPA